jgi:hypothetical protein
MKVTRILLLSLLMTASVAQQGGNNTGGSRGSRPGPPTTLPDVTMGTPDERPGTFDAAMENQRAKMRNEDRQKRLVEDTQKLLTLANQLKEEVDKSSKDTMSISVIKKAEEIEKLAKSVKERMKG